MKLNQGSTAGNKIIPFLQLSYNCTFAILDYIKSYKKFANGRYLSEGIRMTAGILLPAFIMAYFNDLATGVILASGALCVSITDSPGPLKHRANGMLAGIGLIGVAAIITSYAAASVIALGITILIFGFVFSMLTVYGTRISAVGIAALVMMILSLQTPLHDKAIWMHALYIMAGGLWYLLFSALLYRIRPYKIIQQILGDFIESIAEYLRIRGSFYAKNPDYDKTYQLLLQEQIHVQTQQNLLSELLFKTRTIIKESTQTGRVLLKLFLDVSDMFENIMTAYREYSVLHKQFDDTGILEEYHRHIIALSYELEAVALAVKSGDRSVSTKENIESIKQTRAHYETLRLNYLSHETVDNFISIGRILRNLEELAQKIDSLHLYTGYDKKIKKIGGETTNPVNYVESQDISVSLFFNNLNFTSNIFRHSLRVAFSLLVGYIISLYFHIGHSYWILLTIIVILKPAYSLTKTRNKDRLFGTFLGILIGIVILFFIKNNTALLIVMIFFMAISYTFMRTNYFAGVLFMTPYLVIFFHLLYPDNLKMVLTDRLLDTAIGSVIAFLASLFVVPAWEHSTIKTFMIKMLESNQKYYTLIGNAFATADPVEIHTLKKARREMLVSLANLSDAFSRMLSEPKWFQKGIKSVHRFVVLNHMLTSHLATLSYYLTVSLNKYRSKDLLPVIESTNQYFTNAIHCLDATKNIHTEPAKDALKILNDHATTLLAKRSEEIKNGEFETETKKLLVEVKSVIDQFNYIFGIAGDIVKSCKEYE